MEENEGSGSGTTKKFALPSLSEIKRANKVSVVTSAPTLFRRQKHGRRTQTEVPVPPHGGNMAKSSREPGGVRSGHPPSTSHASDMRWKTGADEGSNSVSVSSTLGHKRTREELDSEVELPPKLAETNDRVLPQAETGPQGSTVAEATDSPSIEAVVSSEDRSQVRSLAAASGGVASSSNITTVATPHHPHAIIANPVQKKNPLMKHIRNVPWEVGNIVPDFVLGKTTCAMFLSIRYHCLHPNYIHSRLKELGRQYQLRILLVLVDTKECQKVLQELAKIAILADLTLMLAWSYDEAGRYLETYKAFENKPPDMLMERVDGDFLSRATECLTTVKKVNKTDAATLLSNFQTMDKVITASRDELLLCPGLGPQKAQRLYSLFHQPFRTTKSDTVAQNYC
jgi:DNA excision repair protein ERCC-1